LNQPAVDKFNSIFDERSEHHPYLKRIFLLDSQGKVSSDTGSQKNKLLDFSDQDYFQVLFNNPDKMFYIGYTRIHPETGLHYIPVARSVADKNGILTSVLVGWLDNEVFFDFYQAYDIGKESVFALLHQDGWLMGRLPAAPDMLEKNFAHAPAFNHFKAGQSGTFESLYVHNQSIYISGFSRLDDLNLAVMVGRKKSELLKPWRQSIRNMSLYAVTVITIFVLYTILLQFQIKRKQQGDRKLWESETRFAKAYNANPVAMLIVNTEDMCIVDVNHSFIRTTGFDQKELVGKTILNDQLWENYEYSNKIAKILQEQKAVFDEEVKLRTKSGKILIILLSVEIITFMDKPHALIVTSDITEFRQGQQKLEQSQTDLTRHKRNLESQIKLRTKELEITNAELARANTLKDEFLANMSHELRTPLTAVLGMSEALIEKVYGPLNEQQEKSLQSIESSGQHLLDLINDILDLSKVNAGKMKVETGPVSISSVCHASLQMIKQAAHKKNQTVSLNIDTKEDHITADMIRLKQILVNLLTNAVKFTPEDGKLGIDVTVGQDGNRVEFTVWDTGIGIAGKDMDRLFTPFVQVDGSYTRKHEGTGLGLSLVQKLAGLHGGWVNINSEKQKFTRVTVTLPLEGGIEAQKKPLRPKTNQINYKLGASSV